MRIIVFLTISVIFFSSCAKKYIPDLINASTIKEKGELQASANIAFTGVSSKVSYGITDNFGIMLNGSYCGKDTIFGLQKIQKHKYGEIALGYYKPMGKHLAFNLYMGYGYGKIQSSKNIWENAEWNNDLNIFNNRYFVQPSINYYFGNFFDVSISPKLSLVTIHNKFTKNSSVFISPTTTFKLGRENIKLIMQLGITWKINDIITTTDLFDYNIYIANVGLEVNLFTQKKKKNFSIR